MFGSLVRKRPETVDSGPPATLPENLDLDALDLIKRQFLMHTAIALCRARGSVAGDAYGRFQSTAVAQVSGDVGTAQAVMGDLTG